MCGRIAQGRSAQALAPIYPGLLFADAAALPEGEELGPGQPIALVHGAGAPTLAPTRWASSRRGRAQAARCCTRAPRARHRSRPSATQRAGAAPSRPAKAGPSGARRGARATATGPGGRARTRL